ncbi:MAG TPA: hypothetical protein PLU11_01865 [Chitinophagaceae bacterium]|nr:hypothetical protein [Chitinophagaceae bacterium]HPH31031.1 hypothetical protein [Chitinophagaceae bacterium]HPN57880.1 hypothetical protein [Chitinophagaceae bacterium]
MKFQTRLINFLLPFAAYLLFAFQWFNTYVKAWYANIPEETQYLRGALTNPYIYYTWLFGITSLLHLTIGIVYLVREKTTRPLIYFLMLNLLFTSYYVFLFAADFPKWSRTGPLNFVILCLLGISIVRYYFTLYRREDRE